MRVSDFDDDIAIARAAWAKLVGACPSDVATATSVSQLVGLVAASVPDGATVLTMRSEFTSVTFPFAAQQHRGVTITEAAPADLISQVRRLGYGRGGEARGHLGKPRHPHQNGTGSTSRGRWSRLIMLPRSSGGMRLCPRCCRRRS
jgi:hypothetical protein